MPLNPLRSATHGAGLGAKHNPLAVVTAAVFALLCSFGDTRAQNYPNHPVRMIVPFAPAGPTDVFARLLAIKLAERLGQQFYVENMGGGGGNLGMGAAARAAPDGHTILFVSTSFIVNPSLFAKIPYDPYRDLATVTLAAVSPNIMTINNALPAANVKELIAYLKANPGKVDYASAGNGTIGRVVMAAAAKHLTPVTLELGVDDYEGPRFKRIAHLQRLMGEGRIDRALRWAEGARS